MMEDREIMNKPTQEQLKILLAKFTDDKCPNCGENINQDIFEVLLIQILTFIATKVEEARKAGIREGGDRMIDYLQLLKAMDMQGIISKIMRRNHER